MNPLVYINVVMFSIAMTIMVVLVWLLAAKRFSKEVANQRMFNKLSLLYDLVQDNGGAAAIQVTILIRDKKNMSIDDWSFCTPPPERKEVG